MLEILRYAMSLLLLKYKVKCRKRGEMSQILIGNCGRFIFCSQNFILMERKKREIILCIQNPLCIKIMWL